jgi:lipopolysaccharide export system permease protein
MFKLNNKLIFRKFFTDINRAFLLFLLSFSLIVWAIQAVNFLDYVTEDGHGLLVYLNYTLLNLPKIITRLVPIIFFISIYYIINKYEDSNELKIFWFIGINKKEIVNRMIKFSLLFSLFLMLLTTFTVPLSQKKSRELIISSGIDFFPSLIQEKKFIDTVEGLTIFVEKKEANKYKNIFLKDSKNSNNKIIYAKNGFLINNDKERSIRLYDGKIININEGNISEFNFKNTTFDLSNYVTKSITDFKVQERSTFSLFDCYLNFHILDNKKDYLDLTSCNQPAIKEIETELYKRLIKPTYLVLLSIICALILLTSKENQSNKKYRIFIFILGISVIVLSELLGSFLQRNNFALTIAVSAPIVLSLTIYYFFRNYDSSKLLL